MRLHYTGFLLLLIITFGCSESEKQEPPACTTDPLTENLTTRAFKMGFTTWPYGPEVEDKNETYQFIASHADIYSEQIDEYIPWNAWINNSPLPSPFVDDIENRKSNKVMGHQLLVSVSLLNSSRNDLLEDVDGTIPGDVALNDQKIEDAYFKHLQYIINALDPDYLVFAMEVNDLKINAPDKWEAYKLLGPNIRSRIKSAYPNLKISESITLHNYFNPDGTDQEAFIADITSYANSNNDFAAISFYPFFKGLHSQDDFQQAFNFLHNHITLPIAFVETAHLAEDLNIENLNLNIASDPCEQLAYLDELFSHAQNYNYEFIIWWAYRDFDQLWETFPEEYKDLGQLWRDTGLLDENGEKRPAFVLWETVFNLK